MNDDQRDAVVMADLMARNDRTYLTAFHRVRAGIGLSPDEYDSLIIGAYIWPKAPTEKTRPS